MTTYRVTMTAEARGGNGRCVQGVWVVDADSLADAESKGQRSAMMGGWIPLQVHWVETVAENDARIASQRKAEEKP